MFGSLIRRYDFMTRASVAGTGCQNLIYCNSIDCSINIQAIFL